MPEIYWASSNITARPADKCFHLKRSREAWQPVNTTITGIIERWTKTYYLVDSLSPDPCDFMAVKTHAIRFRWKTLYSSCSLYVRGELRYIFGTCFYFLLYKTSRLMDLVTSNLYFFMGTQDAFSAATYGHGTVQISSRAEEYDLDSETARILFQEWVQCLKLSCMWQMAKVRERVIEEISTLFHQVGHQDLIYLLKVLDKLGISEIRDRFIERLSGSLEPIKLIKLGIDSQYIRCWSTDTQGWLCRKAVSRPNMRSIGYEDHIKTIPNTRWISAKTAELLLLGDKDGVMREVEQLFAEEFMETLWQ